LKTLFAIAALCFSLAAVAKVDCTSEPKEKWQDQEAFKKNLEKDYKIKIFKVTSGNCYEIYGWNKAGQKIEIYFNPITGAKVKERIN
jgi:hypothetical protein